MTNPIRKGWRDEMVKREEEEKEDEEEKESK